MSEFEDRKESSVAASSGSSDACVISGLIVDITTINNYADQNTATNVSPPYSTSESTSPSGAGAGSGKGGREVDKKSPSFSLNAKAPAWVPKTPVATSPAATSPTATLSANTATTTINAANTTALLPASSSQPPLGAKLSPGHRLFLLKNSQSAQQQSKSKAIPNSFPSISQQSAATATSISPTNRNNPYSIYNPYDTSSPKARGGGGGGNTFKEGHINPPLSWQSSMRVKSEDEEALFKILSEQSEEQLLCHFVDATVTPSNGMSIYQTVNLLRHILQDKMGERFQDMTVLGTPVGAKTVATVFETIVTRHLEASNVSFKTEDAIIREWKQERIAHQIKEQSTQPDYAKKVEAVVVQYTPGDVDSRGRQQYSGPCFQCSVRCTVPFKPRFDAAQLPPICHTCQRETSGIHSSSNLTSSSSSNSNSSSDSNSNSDSNSGNSSDSSSVPININSSNDISTGASGGDACSPSASSPPSCEYKDTSGLLTPDFLFPSKVVINGQNIAWLDCKCFYGNASTALTSSKMTQQALKYNTRWGPGAILFAFGYCSSLEIKDVTLLDASVFDLSSLQDAIIKDANEKQIELWYKHKIN